MMQSTMGVMPALLSMPNSLAVSKIQSQKKTQCQKCTTLLLHGLMTSNCQFLLLRMITQSCKCSCHNLCIFYFKQEHTPSSPSGLESLQKNACWQAKKQKKYTYIKNPMLSVAWASVLINDQLLGDCCSIRGVIDDLSPLDVRCLE